MKAVDYKVIGSLPSRPDALDKVTGQAVYGADFYLPGMLAGAVLRSPHAHARILAIDPSAARRLPGVRAVITAADLPALTGDDPRAHYAQDAILARDKALYFGHPLAAVAADDQPTAEKALALIRVAYTPLPPVLDARQAMLPGAPLLHADLYLDDLGQVACVPGNVAAHTQTRRGDTLSGFKSAAVVIEREFVTATVHQGYIEPHAAAAVWSPDGQINVWCSTQGTFGARDQLAGLLQIAPERIRVTPLEIGGGFGGKNDVYLEPLAALLSFKAGGLPVKLVMSRAEVLAASGPTSASIIRVKLGADRAGRLTAAEASLWYEAGAFPGSPLWGAMGCLFSQYRVENVAIDGYDVLVNKPHSSTYRAPGGTNAIFAQESVVDELAQTLGIPPLEFRRLNAVACGDSRPDGSVYEAIGFLETLQSAADSPHYRSALSGPALPGGVARGRGIACACWGGGGGMSSVSAGLDPDGRIRLLMGSVDLAAVRIVVSMQLAETLELPIQAIQAAVGDTHSVGYTEGTYGSRTTVATGLAVHQLGLKLIAGFRVKAAGFWGARLEDVTYAGGGLGWGQQALSLIELAGLLAPGETLGASLTVNSGGWAPGFGVHIVDVEVDRSTGQVALLRYTAVQDVGTAVHPIYVEGQIQGGVAQGIGWALSEGYIYNEEGRLLNPDLANYRLPLSLEMPPIEVRLIHTPNPHHPYGVRGAGELPIVPPPAAIANAIYNAVGARLSELPMTPERVLAAIELSMQGAI